ncbi:substrate-binding domain-containing protein [Anabaena cylindrica UHCC 0172]|uniref:substrate-binding domain-containing protein n=1 Tax=Anabaena cylindrica TaxID=1165 RepID=UPI002B21A62D|nr:substrate-binding domain-containing protein [Anabaena cylindrica]MEA5553618.1 substrate-binding domain-containing protein [Anabaena cylindrica UHCC 0172]
MWQEEKKDSVIIRLALSLALATTPLTANLLVSAPVLAESAADVNTFPQPQTVENGTIVRIDGSINLATINQSLKDNFEKQFSGTQVELGVNGTDAALKALLDGKIDIAAIARGLTPEEKLQGLEQVRLRREKIAIIVGANNPFQGSLTSEQFAQIFRGEITDWSELGGKSGKIRFIDHPSTSDTRNSFRDYPVFKSGEFSTGANAIQVSEDKTAEIIKQLGTDGISYVIANQVSQLQDVRTLKVQEISPDSSKYPFSQPLVYVYKQNPSSAVASFLGFTTAPVGQKTIDAARDAEASAIAASALQMLTTETSTSVTPEAIPVPNTTANAGNEQQFVNPVENNRNVIFLMLLSLLPVVGLGGFLTWWLRKRKRSKDSLETSISSTTIPPSTSDEYSIIPPVNNAAITNGTSHLAQNTTTIVSNTEEHLTLTEAETLESSLVSVTAKETNTIEGNTNNLDTSAETIALDCGEVVWDTEAPVAVVNTPYPSVPNFPEIVFDIELPTDEFTGSLSELLNEPAVLSHQESSTSLSELLDEPASTSHQNGTNSFSEVISLLADSSNTESSTSLSELLDVLVNSPNAESNTSLLNSLTATTAKSNKESSTSLSELLGLLPAELDLELVTEESTNSEFELSDELGDIFNTLADEAEFKADLTEEASSSLSIPSHRPQLTTDQSPLNTIAEIEDLASIDSIQDYALSDLQGQSNISEAASSLDIDANSSIVFTPRTPKWAYVSWYVSESQKEVLRKKGGTLLAVRLYDTTDIDLSYQIPQLVQQYECEEATHDCYVAIPTSNRDYITEIGYVTDSNAWMRLARSGTVRIFQRPSADFWFVADTELVIHGATEPGATVTIDGHIIKPKSDGTFQFRVPFSDRLLNYLLTATAINGEQSRTIHKKFSQESSES